MSKQNKISKLKTEVIQKKDLTGKPKIVWFKITKFGYGWYPANWRGWATIVVYLIFNFTNYLLIKSQTKSESDLWVNFIFDLLLSTLLLVLVAINKGDKVSWKKDNKPL